MSVNTNESLNNILTFFNYANGFCIMKIGITKTVILRFKLDCYKYRQIVSFVLFHYNRFNPSMFHILSLVYLCDNSQFSLFEN